MDMATMECAALMSFIQVLIASYDATVDVCVTAVEEVRDYKADLLNLQKFALNSFHCQLSF